MSAEQHVALRWVDPRDDVVDEAAAVLPLSDAEHRRLATVPDRRRFLLGRALLRATAAELVGAAPDEVRIIATCPECGTEHGRPEAILPDGRRVHVSLSHSPTATVAVASLAGDIGVDVEMIDAARFAGVEDVALSARERAGWLQLPKRQRLPALAQFWTRKEAVLKAIGTGLRVDPATIEVTTPSRDHAPRVLVLPAALAGPAALARPAAPALSTSIRLQDVQLSQGLAASIAIILTADPSDLSDPSEPTAPAGADRA
ncbi:4'-phosphopantetheinyl transferase family protein [Plantibacter sp. Mn2098]|uniref:4'-phosphopantetheinyl transferase family protein n=1 Tax=Plantibacter sp. Mn2098 TaxID=3395266 RepID=UPI003BD7F8A4